MNEAAWAVNLCLDRTLISRHNAAPLFQDGLGLIELMSNADAPDASAPTRKRIVIALVVWLVLAIALPLTALTLNAVRFGDVPFGFFVAAQGVLVGLAVLALIFSRRAGERGGKSNAGAALHLSSEMLGSLAIVGAAGAVAALGFDGLPAVIGLVAGLALLTILIAPRFARTDAQSLPGYFAEHFGGPVPRIIAIVIVLASATLLLAADIRGAALAVQGLSGLGYASGVAVAALGVGTVVALAQMIGFRSAILRGLIFLVIAVLLGLALASFAGRNGELPFPHFTYGAALSALATLNQQLISAKLADFASLQPMASPFLKQSMVNFAGLVLAVAFGIAAAPHLIARHLSRDAVAPGDAARRAALATVLVAVVAAGIAPLAVHSRLALGEILVPGVASAAPPQALVDASGAAWIDVCGTTSSAAEEIAAACAKMPGQKGYLRLQDVGRPGDSFIVAAPIVAGLAPWATLAFYASLLIGALVAGYGIVAGLASSISDRGHKSGDEASAPGLGVWIAMFAAIGIAALIAARGHADIVDLAMDGLALAAAGLFPALVLSLYWRGMSGAGVAAAMIIGFAVAALYILGVRLFPLQLYAWTGALSDAGAGEAGRIATLQESISRAASPAALEAAQTALARSAQKAGNWFGLKAPAIVLIAVPAGIIAGALISVIGRAAGSRRT